MEQTLFSDKVTILAEAYMDDSKVDDIQEIFHHYDLGAPLCLAIYNGGATPNDVGIAWIEEAFDGLCEILQIDKYGKYECWDDILLLLEESGVYDSND